MSPQDLRMYVSHKTDLNNCFPVSENFIILRIILPYSSIIPSYVNN